MSSANRNETPSKEGFPRVFGLRTEARPYLLANDADLHLAAVIENKDSLEDVPGDYWPGGPEESERLCPETPPETGSDQTRPDRIATTTTTPRSRQSTA